MQIAVRIDDITPDMDWEKFRRLEKILDENDIAPLLGIVPDNQDPNLKRGELLSDFQSQIELWKEKNWSFSMHGWNHIYTTKKGGLFPLNSFSEYAGVPLSQQRKMIRQGKERLSEMGIYTDIFMAPGHSFDSNTLVALKEEGFHYITDGFGSFPYSWKELIFLPIAFLRNKDIQKKEGYTTLVFHPNTMSEGDFAAFERLVKEYKKDFISYHEYLKAPVRKQTLIGRGKEYAIALIKRLLVLAYTMKNHRSSLS